MSKQAYYMLSDPLLKRDREQMCVYYCWRGECKKGFSFVKHERFTSNFGEKKQYVPEYDLAYIHGNSCSKKNIFPSDFDFFMFERRIQVAYFENPCSLINISKTYAYTSFQSLFVSQTQRACSISTLTKTSQTQILMHSSSLMKQVAVIAKMKY